VQWDACFTSVHDLPAAPAPVASCLWPAQRLSLLVLVLADVFAFSLFADRVLSRGPAAPAWHNIGQKKCWLAMLITLIVLSAYFYLQHQMETNNRKPNCRHV